MLNHSRSEIFLLENAEFVGAKCLTISTALDCSRNYVRGECLFPLQEAITQSKNNNSQGPDKLNIRHLKHIDPLGLAFLTSMLKTALNTNIIPTYGSWLTSSPSQNPTRT